MAKQPYPSQMAPKPAKRGEPKPYKNPYEDTRGNMQKPTPYPQRKLKPAVKDAMGIMGSSNEQAKQRKEKMLYDMRKRMMLRKKQGQ